MEADMYGLLAEFESPEALLEAVNQARKDGYQQMDAYTPWPVKGLAEALGIRKTGIAPMVLAGGILGGLTGYAMQYYTVAINYPLNVGGRPLHSWPAFIAITFELTVLGAALAGLAGMLILNGLPRLHHPVFEVERFDRASIDGFFMCIQAEDPRFAAETTRTLLQQTGAVGIWEVTK
jgi:hypothetical protein